MSDSVVKLSETLAGVVHVRMEDRENKNTFSDGLVNGLTEAFDEIGRNDRYKVVVLSGYDSYFASGGNQETLLGLSDGKVQFTDRDLYSLALNCPVPVVSAMQGHGIGGGFVMGLFADFVVLSRESIYTTNFMKYGFTPGMGATFILPRKLGTALATEMLLSAKTYRGEELQKRGVPFPVVPRDDVVEYAEDLADSISDKPRVSLVTLKDHLVDQMRKELPHAIENEVGMHQKTFHQPEVRERIKTIYNG